MSAKDQQSIAFSVGQASERPDDTEGGANVGIPQLFAEFPVPQGEKVIDDTAPSDGKNIQGIPRYNFRAHLKRYIIGQVEIGRDERGQPEFLERDDSAHYEQLMNDVLEGNAIIRWEERSTLRDGTIVISVSYLTPKVKPKQKRRG